MKRKNGVMEYWSDGVMECWNDGEREYECMSVRVHEKMLKPDRQGGLHSTCLNIDWL